MRVSQKKLTQLGKILRGKTIDQAVAFLTLQPQKGADILKKAVLAARNNAEQEGVKINNLTIAGVACQKGPIFMRRWIKAKGRSTPKRKPTSHAMIVFADAKPVKEKWTPKAKPAKE